MVFNKGFPPNSATVRRVRAWLADHPGASTEEIAEAVAPGKATGASTVGEVLRCLRGRCQVRRDDGDRWTATG